MFAIHQIFARKSVNFRNRVKNELELTVNEAVNVTWTDVPSVKFCRIDDWRLSQHRIIHFYSLLPATSTNCLLFYSFFNIWKLIDWKRKKKESRIWYKSCWWCSTWICVSGILNKKEHTLCLSAGKKINFPCRYWISQSCAVLSGEEFSHSR